MKDTSTTIKLTGSELPDSDIRQWASVWQQETGGHWKLDTANTSEAIYEATGVSKTKVEATVARTIARYNKQHSKKPLVLHFS